MVHPHKVKLCQGAPYPPDPPLIAILLHCLPVIKGIPPVLPLRRKVVRRAPSPQRGIAVFIQLELLPIGPDIRTVHCRIDWQIPNQCDPQLPGPFFYQAPLVEKRILLFFQCFQLFCIDALYRFKISAVPLVLRPALPGRSAVYPAQQHKEHIIL